MSILDCPADPSRSVVTSSPVACKPRASAYFSLLLLALLPLSTATAATQGRPPRPAESSPGQTAAQDTPTSDDSSAEAAEATTKPPQPLQVDDAADWQRVARFALTQDAQWCGYHITPAEGDGRIVVRQVEGDKRHEFKVGPSSSGPVFSHDGKYVAFVSRALEKEAKAARQAKKPASSKVVLIELASETVSEIPDGQSFQFGGEASQWLAIRKRRPESQPSGKEGWSGTDLVLHDLKSGQRLSFGNVSEYGFNKSGSWLALVIDAQSKLGNGLQLFDCQAQQLTVLESDTAHFKQLQWHREADALALLKAQTDDDYEQELHELIAYRDVAATDRHRVHVDPFQDPGVAEHLTISSNRSPMWTENLDGVLFGVHDAVRKEKKTESKQAGGDGGEEDAGLVIWHFEDERLQSRQQVTESADKRFNYLCIHRVDNGNTIQIATEDMRDASTQRPHRFAIATDNSPYELAGNLDGRRFQDVYVIDLKTGKRRLALKKHRWMFGMSPSGEQMLYYLDGHFFAYDMVTGQSANLTENVPTSFIDTEDDHNVDDPPTRPLGWTTDGRYVLLSDDWDIWQVSVRGGGEGINLTQNGKADGLRYRGIQSFGRDEPGVDLTGDAYVNIYSEWTKEAGFGRLRGGEPGVERLVWEKALFSGLNQPDGSEHFYFSRQTPDESPDFHVAGPDLQETTQVTQLNPQQKHFKWSEGVQLVDYESTQGDRLQAALLLPADYIEGKSYPTVIYIYEKLSQRAYAYNSPRVGGFSPAIYTSQGYAVLMPDIVYRVNDPGLSAVECVIPAVEAAIETGVVDREHIGLHGHSWGGYQTSFLITQTDLFKAAVAGAPLTNLISMYSSIYWNSGRPNQPIFESSQGRFTGGYWTNLDAYTRNSPVYYAEQVETPLLLLHNDQDGAVDWNQGIEYFNTLRRLQKPVVMLQYKGENHGLAKLPNRKDYSYRMLDFFNHYLKGEKAPPWWAEGIDHLQMEDHIREYRKSKQAVTEE